VLSCLRLFIDQRATPSQSLQLNQSDFNVAMSLAKHLISNSAKHMAEMPGVNNDIIKYRKLQFMIVDRQHKVDISVTKQSYT